MIRLNVSAFCGGTIASVIKFSVALFCVLPLSVLDCDARK